MKGINTKHAVVLATQDFKVCTHLAFLLCVSGFTFWQLFFFFNFKIGGLLIILLSNFILVLSLILYCSSVVSTYSYCPFSYKSKG